MLQELKPLVRSLSLSMCRMETVRCKSRSDELFPLSTFSIFAAAFKIRRTSNQMAFVSSQVYVPYGEPIAGAAACRRLEHQLHSHTFHLYL